MAVVTDSTASLSAAEVARYGLKVVPLHVMWGGHDRLEPDLSDDELIAALTGRSRVTTSRPSPELFDQTFAELAAAGVGEIVSVHLSAEASGTCEAAMSAAERAGVPVHVVDSRQLAMGTGYAALAAARAADSGLSGVRVAEAARHQAEQSRVYFALDTLDYLRRGGRMSLAGAVVGSALSVKPLLDVHEGRIRLRERVRTATRARDRLVELAAGSLAELGAGFGQVQATVQHLGAGARAHALAPLVSEVLGVEVLVRPVSAVVGVHAGPGVLGVSVAALAG